MAKLPQRGSEEVDSLRRNLVIGGLTTLTFPTLLLPKIAQGSDAKQGDLWWVVNWDQLPGSVLCYLGLEPSLADHYFDFSRTVKTGGPSKRERDSNHLYPYDLVPLVMENVPVEKRHEVRDAVKYLKWDVPHWKRFRPHRDKEIFGFQFNFYRAVIEPICEKSRKSFLIGR